MKILLTILICSLLKDIKGQSVIYRGEKSYPATNEWQFEIKSSIPEGFPQDILKVTVAKISQTTGYLMLTVAIHSYKDYIDGLVLLYLDNGKVITIQKRSAGDKVDWESSALFILNSTQINLLKGSKILKIRYNIYGDLDTGSHTASNFGKNNDSYNEAQERALYKTDNEIAELFSEEDQ